MSQGSSEACTIAPYSPSVNDPAGSRGSHLWQTAEASNSVFLEAMERHGHLSLGTEIREAVLKASAAVRTFADWNDPPPGFFEMDMVAHCGKSVAGRHAHSVVLTDIASGWTEACALVVPEPTRFTLVFLRHAWSRR